MKITVNQLRKIIKEEISRVMSESDGKVQSGNLSIFLRAKVQQMVDKPDMEQRIADTWDAAVGKVPEMMDYIKKNSTPGYISSTARTEAILNAEKAILNAAILNAETLIDVSEVANYLNSALEMSKTNPDLTGDKLKVIAADFKERLAKPKKSVNSDPELAWNRDHPNRHWRST